MKAEMEQAIQFRKENRPEDAFKMLSELLKINSEDPDLNFQMAWTCDSMGRESDAVPFYERALASGLVEGRAQALLGLASTCRSLGEYEKSLQLFDQAIAEFPGDRALKVFRSLCLYNLGRFEDSVSSLLQQLLETTSDPGIASYGQALKFYSDQLNQKWS